jgi:hypothetical protein
MDADTVILTYPDNVKSRFKAILIMLTLLIVILPWLHIFHGGWLQLLIILDLILFLFYWYRIRREIEVSESGIREKMGRSETFWRWNEIAEIHEVVTHESAEPSARMTIEHQSTHQVSFDTQMGNFAKAREIVEVNWSGCISVSRVTMILMKYW